MKRPLASITATPRISEVRYFARAGLLDAYFWPLASTAFAATSRRRHCWHDVSIGLDNGFSRHITLLIYSFALLYFDRPGA